MGGLNDTSLWDSGAERRNWKISIIAWFISKLCCRVWGRSQIFRKKNSYREMPTRQSLSLNSKGVISRACFFQKAPPQQMPFWWIKPGSHKWDSWGHSLAFLGWRQGASPGIKHLRFLFAHVFIIHGSWHHIHLAHCGCVLAAEAGNRSL